MDNSTTNVDIDNKNNLSEKKKRVKTLKSQYLIYLNYISENSILTNAKFVPSDSKDLLKSVWDKMVIELNSVGGPIRDIDGWRKIFTEWKCTVKRKVREKRELTREERRLLYLTCKYEGKSGVPVPIKEEVDEEHEYDVIKVEHDDWLEGEEDDLNDTQSEDNESVNNSTKRKASESEASGPSKKFCEPIPHPKDPNELLQAFIEQSKDQVEGMRFIGSGLYAIAEAINNLATKFNK